MNESFLDGECRNAVASLLQTRIDDRLRTLEIVLGERFGWRALQGTVPFNTFQCTGQFSTPQFNVGIGNHGIGFTNYSGSTIGSTNYVGCVPQSNLPGYNTADYGMGYHVKAPLNGNFTDNLNDEQNGNFHSGTHQNGYVTNNGLANGCIASNVDPAINEYIGNSNNGCIAHNNECIADNDFSNSYVDPSGHPISGHLNEHSMSIGGVNQMLNGLEDSLYCRHSDNGTPVRMNHVQNDHANTNTYQNGVSNVVNSTMNPTQVGTSNIMSRMIFNNGEKGVHHAGKPSTYLVNGGFCIGSESAERIAYLPNDPPARGTYFPNDQKALEPQRLDASLQAGRVSGQPETNLLQSPTEALLQSPIKIQSPSESGDGETSCLFNSSHFGSPAVISYKRMQVTNNEQPELEDGNPPNNGTSAEGQWQHISPPEQANNSPEEPNSIEKPEGWQQINPPEQPNSIEEPEDWVQVNPPTEQINTPEQMNEFGIRFAEQTNPATEQIREFPAQMTGLHEFPSSFRSTRVEQENEHPSDYATQCLEETVASHVPRNFEQPGFNVIESNVVKVSSIENNVGSTTSSQQINGEIFLENRQQLQYQDNTQQIVTNGPHQHMNTVCYGKGSMNWSGPGSNTMQNLNGGYNAVANGGYRFGNSSAGYQYGIDFQGYGNNMQGYGNNVANVNSIQIQSLIRSLGDALLFLQQNLPHSQHTCVQHSQYMRLSNDIYMQLKELVDLIMRNEFVVVFWSTFFAPSFQSRLMKVYDLVMQNQKALVDRSMIGGNGAQGSFVNGNAVHVYGNVINGNFAGNLQHHQQQRQHPVAHNQQYPFVAAGKQQHLHPAAGNQQHQHPAIGKQQHQHSAAGNQQYRHPVTGVVGLEQGQHRERYSDEEPCSEQRDREEVILDRDLFNPDENFPTRVLHSDAAHDARGEERLSSKSDVELHAEAAGKDVRIPTDEALSNGEDDKATRADRNRPLARLAARDQEVLPKTQRDANSNGIVNSTAVRTKKASGNRSKPNCKLDRETYRKSAVEEAYRNDAAEGYNKKDTSVKIRKDTELTCKSRRSTYEIRPSLIRPSVIARHWEGVLNPLERQRCERLSPMTNYRPSESFSILGRCSTQASTFDQRGLFTPIASARNSFSRNSFRRGARNPRSSLRRNSQDARVSFRENIASSGTGLEAETSSSISAQSHVECTSFTMPQRESQFNIRARHKREKQRHKCRHQFSSVEATSRERRRTYSGSDFGAHLIKNGKSSDGKTPVIIRNGIPRSSTPTQGTDGLGSIPRGRSNSRPRNSILLTDERRQRKLSMRRGSRRVTWVEEDQDGETRPALYDLPVEMLELARLKCCRVSTGYAASLARTSYASLPQQFFEEDFLHVSPRSSIKSHLDYCLESPTVENASCSRPAANNLILSKHVGDDIVLNTRSTPVINAPSVVCGPSNRMFSAPTLNTIGNSRNTAPADPAKPIGTPAKNGVVNPRPDTTPLDVMSRNVSPITSSNIGPPSIGPMIGKQLDEPINKSCSPSDIVGNKFQYASEQGPQRVPDILLNGNLVSNICSATEVNQSQVGGIQSPEKVDQNKVVVSPSEVGVPKASGQVLSPRAIPFAQGDVARNISYQPWSIREVPPHMNRLCTDDTPAQDTHGESCYIPNNRDSITPMAHTMCDSYLKRLCTDQSLVQTAASPAGNPGNQFQNSLANPGRNFPRIAAVLPKGTIGSSGRSPGNPVVAEETVLRKGTDGSSGRKATDGSIGSTNFRPNPPLSPEEVERLNSNVSIQALQKNLTIGDLPRISDRTATETESSSRRDKSSQGKGSCKSSQGKGSDINSVANRNYNIIVPRNNSIGNSVPSLSKDSAENPGLSLPDVSFSNDSGTASGTGSNTVDDATQTLNRTLKRPHLDSGLSRPRLDSGLGTGNRNRLDSGIARPRGSILMTDERLAERRASRIFAPPRRVTLLMPEAVKESNSPIPTPSGAAIRPPSCPLSSGARTPSRVEKKDNDTHIDTGSAPHITSSTSPVASEQTGNQGKSTENRVPGDSISNVVQKDDHMIIDKTDGGRDETDVSNIPDLVKNGHTDEDSNLVRNRDDLALLNEENLENLVVRQRCLKPEDAVRMSMAYSVARSSFQTLARRSSARSSARSSPCNRGSFRSENAGLTRQSPSAGTALNITQTMGKQDGASVQNGKSSTTVQSNQNIVAEHTDISPQTSSRTEQQKATQTNPESAVRDVAISADAAIAASTHLANPALQNYGVLDDIFIRAEANCSSIRAAVPPNSEEDEETPSSSNQAGARVHGGQTGSSDSCSERFESFGPTIERVHVPNPMIPRENSHLSVPPSGLAHQYNCTNESSFDMYSQHTVRYIRQSHSPQNGYNSYQPVPNLSMYSQNSRTHGNSYHQTSQTNGGNWYSQNYYNQSPHNRNLVILSSSSFESSGPTPQLSSAPTPPEWRQTSSCESSDNAYAQNFSNPVFHHIGFNATAFSNQLDRLVSPQLDRLASSSDDTHQRRPHHRGFTGQAFSGNHQAFSGNQQLGQNGYHQPFSADQQLSQNAYHQAFSGNYQAFGGNQQSHQNGNSQGNVFNVGRQGFHYLDQSASDGDQMPTVSNGDDDGSGAHIPTRFGSQEAVAAAGYLSASQEVVAPASHDDDHQVDATIDTETLVGAAKPGKPDDNGIFSLNTGNYGSQNTDFHLVDLKSGKPIGKSTVECGNVERREVISSLAGSDTVPTICPIVPELIYEKEESDLQKKSSVSPLQEENRDLDCEVHNSDNIIESQFEKSSVSPTSPLRPLFNNDQDRVLLHDSSERSGGVVLHHGSAASSVIPQISVNSVVPQRSTTSDEDAQDKRMTYMEDDSAAVANGFPVLAGSDIDRFSNGSFPASNIILLNSIGISSTLSGVVLTSTNSNRVGESTMDFAQLITVRENSPVDEQIDHEQVDRMSDRERTTLQYGECVFREYTPLLDSVRESYSELEATRDYSEIEGKRRETDQIIVHTRDQSNKSNIMSNAMLAHAVGTIDEERNAGEATSGGDEDTSGNCSPGSGVEIPFQTGVETETRQLKEKSTPSTAQAKDSLKEENSISSTDEAHTSSV